MSITQSKLYQEPDICDLITGPVAKPGPELNFYLEHCRQAHGPILDLGCGTGRLTIPLSTYGCRISGLDLSQKMLLKAEAKALKENLNIYWIQDDFRRLSSVRRFGLIYMSSDTLNLMHARSDFETLLHGVMAHLQPNGLFVFSIFNPNLVALTEDNASRGLEQSHLIDPKSRRTLKSTQTQHYDCIAQLIHKHYAFSWNKGKVFLNCSLTQRCVFPEELNNLLHYNGFEMIERFGNYEGGEFEPTSSRQVIVARPRAR